jgi:solute carrier family 35, member F5
MVVQFLYTEQHFDSPFLLTYIGTTLFVVLLPSRLLWERTCGGDVIPWTTTDSYQHIPTGTVDFEDHASRSEPPACAFTINDDDDDDEQPSSMRQPQLSVPEYVVLSHRQHLMMALKIAPIWFLGNWAYNTSLAYTSITSSTVLASTGSVFTFLFAVLCGDERFTLLKCLGVLLGVWGSVLTGWNDAPTSIGSNNSTDTAAMAPSALFLPAMDDRGAMWGDALGLLSAVGYGTYTVMIRVQCPKDERAMSMQLLLGYIGLWNALILSPIAFYVLPTNQLTTIVIGYLVAQGLLDNVLSDYLWARAVLLTSATVATVGLGLTIPLAFVSDWIMGHGSVTALSIGGALAVLLGFVLVNVDGARTSSEDIDWRATTNDTDQEMNDVSRDNIRVI